MSFTIRTDMNVYLPYDNYSTDKTKWWDGDPIYKPITVLRMMCASVYTEEVERICLMKEPIKNGFIEVKKLSGETLTINTRYIVSAEDFDLCTCIYSSQRGGGIMSFLVKAGEKVVLHDKYL